MNYITMNQQLKIRFRSELYVSDAMSVRGGGRVVGGWRLVPHMREQLAVGSWQLTVGCWQLAVDS
jgi:hypothetical protein